MVDTFDCTKINLKYGDKGAQVTLLQTHLKTLGYYTKVNGVTLKVDGDFGEYTEAAVKKFQKDTGHSDDGVFGPKTCPDLNKKILEKNGVKTEDTATESNKATNNTPSSSQPKADPYALNSKVQYLERKEYEGNIWINGIGFIASTLKRTNELHTPDWKQVQFMDGSISHYLGQEKPLQYTIEVYIPNRLYGKIKPELEKMGYRPRDVYTKLFRPGKYVIGVTVEDEKVSEKKVTMNFTEWKG